ncbi:hypothetical protein TSUD_424520, partial [Trifolium subterraneum]
MSESNNIKEVSLESLPEPILHDVLATIGSQGGIADFYNVKLCSKNLGKLADDNYVLKKVSLKNSPKILFEPNAVAYKFLKQCEASGNIDVLFSEGLRDFFNYPDGNIGGLQKLKIAAEEGHNLAKYVYGLILLSSGNDEY